MSLAGAIPQSRKPCLLCAVLVGSAAFGSPSQGEGPTAEGTPHLVPPSLLEDSPARYPEDAGEVGASVTLAVVVDEQGEVSSAQVVGQPPAAFAQAALHAAAGLRFLPATLAGKPVAVEFPFTYHFRPPPRPELTGVVRSRQGGAPIPGVQVRVQGRAEDVALTTGPDGTFRVTLPKGAHALSFEAPGYAPLEGSAALSSPGERHTFFLEGLQGREPFASVVRDERPTGAASVRLRGAELKELPGALGDPFRVLALLPGVAGLASGASYPVVRGSQPSETAYFLDGVRVPVLFHVLLGPSVVYPDSIESLEFYPGAAPAALGRMIGGAVTAKLAAPSPAPRATGYVDLVNAGLFAEAPLWKDRTYASVAGRFSYSPWLIGQASRAFQKGAQRRLVFDFADYQARLEQKLGGGSARVFAFGSSDRASTLRDEDTHGIVFHRADLRLRQPAGRAGEVEVGLTAGLDRLQYVHHGDGGVRTLDFDTTSVAARASYSASLEPRLALTVGADLDHRRARKRDVLRASSPQLPGFDQQEPVAAGTFAGLHGQLAYARAGHWALTPGLRLDAYHLAAGETQVVLEPRLHGRRQLGEFLALRAGMGLYHQPPATLLALPVADLASLSHGLQRAAQVTAGLEGKAVLGLQWTVDVYVNPLLRVVEVNPFEDTALGDLPVTDLLRRRVESASGEGATRGRAYGLELMVRRPIGDRWFGWLSYTLQRSERWTRFDRYDVFGQPVAQGAGYLPSGLDQTHVFNAVVSYRLVGRWTLGAAVHFRTGRPETGALTSSTQRRGLDGLSEPIWIPEDLDRADRLPPFFRLDARVSNTWRFDAFSLEAYLDFFNLTLTREVVGYKYLYEPVLGERALAKVTDGALVAFPLLGVKGSY